MATSKVGSRVVTWGLVLQLAWVGLADAGLGGEFELDGTATNNSAATADAIPRSAFTLPVPDEVFNPPGFPTATIFGRGGGLGFEGGPSDVDIFRISGHGGLVLDIDTAGLTSFDTILSLFNGSGLLLAMNDDNSNDPGSVDVTNHDSLIFFTLPGPGVYFVAVTQWQNFPCDETLPCSLDTAFIPSRNGPQPEEGEDAGSYVLHISLQHPHPIPLPPTGLLVGSVIGLAGLVARCWRFRSRQP
jgi:hypothetical protein